MVAKKSSPCQRATLPLRKLQVVSMIARVKQPTFAEESNLRDKGYEHIIGVDEVGRGAFAGPVVAAAVAYDQFDEQIVALGINDSKLLRPRTRQRLAKEIAFRSRWSIGVIGVSAINRVGIGRATQMAFRKAVLNLVNGRKENVAVLVDGFHIRYLRGIGRANQKAIIKGDRKSISIASASILAKVYRDKLMRGLAKKYPQYGFGKHKGYGTRFHQNALRRFGIAKVHRVLFLKQFLTT